MIFSDKFVVFFKNRNRSGPEQQPRIETEQCSYTGISNKIQIEPQYNVTVSLDESRAVADSLWFHKPLRTNSQN